MEMKFFNQLMQSPIKKTDLKQILQNNFLTLRLISEYSYFLIDGNKDLYIDFINKNIRNKKNLFIIIELANLIEYYSPSLINLLKNILKKRLSTLLKISCLDYLAYNQLLIEKNQYEELNLIAIRNSKSRLIIFQGKFNLGIIMPFRITNMSDVFDFIYSTKDNNLIERSLIFLKTNSYLGSAANESIKTKLIKLQNTF